MAVIEQFETLNCRMIVVGGHTRSIGKTQLICDLIAALPEASWIAGKITQYGHGICARNGQCCDCAPKEHTAAISWETSGKSGTDSARFLAAGARRSFWLRTKQGHLDDGLPLLQKALEEVRFGSHGDRLNVIVESNSLLQYLEPSIYLAVLDGSKTDFKDSAQAVLSRASAYVFRRGLEEGSPSAPPWSAIPEPYLREKPSFLQREGEPLPELLRRLVQQVIDVPAKAF